MRRPTLVALLCLASAARTPGHACTTFCTPTADGVVFGRNYDFEIGEGAVLINARGLDKSGFLPEGPVWRATYGSVTFNQFGRGFPMGGMNESGLVVELMWLDVTRYPAPDARQPLHELEWIQYQLDTAATVDDVLQSDHRVRIAADVPLHYLVSDARGNAAAIEFLDGRLIAHAGSDLPVAALANTTYEDSLRSFQAQGGRARRGAGSLERFSRAAAGVPGLARLAGGAAVDRAFEILDSATNSATRWSIVYEQTARVVHFRTDRLPARRVLRLADLDFSCRSIERALPLEIDVRGDVHTALVDFPAAANRRLVERDYAKSSVTRRTPPVEVARVAAQAERERCALP